jgi:hypothetical protein
LTDLTFIEDGIPSIIKKTNLINFAKRAKTAEVIRDIQQYQNVAYSLQPVPELQDYILSNMQAAGDVHEMYDKSLLIEPREREDEKIVRYVELSPCVSLDWDGGANMVVSAESWLSLASYERGMHESRPSCRLCPWRRSAPYFASSNLFIEMALCKF